MNRILSYLLLLLPLNIFASFYNPTARPDNFQQITIKKKARGPNQSLNIDMIYTSPKQKYIVIDGKTYHKGDTLQHYEISAIHDNSVLLKSGSEQHVLPMTPTVISTPGS